MTPTMTYNFVAKDQYGNVHFLKKNPRKELMDIVGTSHTENFYVDLPNGETLHVGYILHDHWYKIYRLALWKEIS